MAKLTRDELVKKLEIESLDFASQQAMLENLAAAVSSRLMNKITEKLSDEDIDQLNELIDKDDQDGVEWYIKSKFEHYDEMAEATEEEVINELVENSRRANEAIERLQNSSNSAQAQN